MGERESVTSKQLWQAFGLMLLTWLPLAWLDGALRNDFLPAGILSFELIGSTARADYALSLWDERARSHALWSLLLDFPFMFAYALWMSRLARWGGESLAGRSTIVYGWRRVAAKAAWVAAGLDGVENAALLVVLLASTAQPWPGLATAAASLKFALLMFSLFYGSTTALVGIMPEEAPQP